MTSNDGLGSSRAAWTLVPIIAASGFAGLGYEMVWTRLLSVALGTEMMAVLGSVAGFFAGLAFGAFILDGPIRRARSPRVAYAVLEGVIGLWGLISVWLLPAAGRLLPPLLGTDPAPALLWTVSFALPCLALLPATAAMGGTLTALERMLTAASGAGRLSAGVYGANTAGAVAGTLVSAFILFRAVGLSGTLMCLAGLNAICALAALALGPQAERAPVAANKLGLPMRGYWGLTFSLFITGLLGIAAEVLVIRLAAQTLQNTLYTFAGLLAAYLLGTALGGLIWQRAARTTWQSSLASLLAATSLACLLTAFATPFLARIAASAASAGSAGELVAACASFLLPSAAMGALFGYLAQCVRDARGSLGWAVGANSIGAALAPILASQVFIPTFGAWRALVLVALGYLLLLPLRRASLIWIVAPAVCGLVLLSGPAPSLIRVPFDGHVLAVREGPMVTASAVDDASGARFLEVNGHFRMGGTSSTRSDYRQALLPLLLHPAPHHALFLGVGTGATLVGGAHLPGVLVHGVELSPEVVELLPWFENATAMRSMPALTIADARRYVAADEGQYDVIIADLFHPALDGSGALYTAEHFAAVRKRLLPGGLFCQWLPLYQLDLPSLRTIIRTFLDIYPGASAWLNHYSVRTPMLVLVGPRSGGFLDLDSLTARLRDPGVSAVARAVGFDVPMDLLGQYVGGARTLAALAGEGARNTDDYPYVALDASRNVRALTAAPADLLMAVVHSAHPDPAELLAAPHRPQFAGRLTAYWRARDRFLEAGAALHGEPRGLALVAAASPGLLDSIRLSAEFDPAYQPLIAMARSLLDSDRQAAARLLQAIDRAAPSRGDARDLLAREFAR
jgi:spermidine synthase